jgi:monovalent cation/hydrogen antiporter
MHVFQIVVALLLGGAALAAIARRVGAPYPALVALAGAGLALIPGVPTLALDPDLALALFIAPVLVDAAFDASPRDLRAGWRPILGLALGAVALTITVVAVAAKAMVPEMPWAAAIALGAIVAPPDAAAGTTVLRQVRPPNRLLVILEGESLFNDASALLVYRLAVNATIAGSVSVRSVVPTLLGVTLASVVLALVLARLTMAVTARVRDVATAVVVQFCTAFGVWMLAESLHLSGIITMVVFAMAASRRAPEVLPARIRIPAWAVWEVAVFVLNVLAFILVGFQLRSITTRVAGPVRLHYFVIAVVVSAAVILTRLAWVGGAAAVGLWRRRGEGRRSARQGLALTAASAAVVGWCGMRGTVTLAAALALPAAYPQRDLILATAFGVVLATLVVQGLTMRPLLSRVRLGHDDTVEREVRLARVESLRAAVTAAGSCEAAETARLVRHRYELQLRRAKADARDAPDGDARAPRSGGGVADVAVVRAATDAQRRRLLALRDDGTIGDAAFQRVEEELDWAELDWAKLLGTGDEAGEQGDRE